MPKNPNFEKLSRVDQLYENKQQNRYQTYQQLRSDIAAINVSILNEAANISFDSVYDSHSTAARSLNKTIGADKKHFKKRVYGIVVGNSEEIGRNVYVDVPLHNTNIVKDDSIFLTDTSKMEEYQELIFFPNVGTLQATPQLGTLAVVLIPENFPNHTLSNPEDAVFLDVYRKDIISPLDIDRPPIRAIPDSEYDLLLRAKSMINTMRSSDGAFVGSGGPCSDVDWEAVEPNTPPTAGTSSKYGFNVTGPTTGIPRTTVLFVGGNEDTANWTLDNALKSIKNNLWCVTSNNLGATVKETSSMITIARNAVFEVANDEKDSSTTLSQEELMRGPCVIIAHGSGAKYVIENLSNKPPAQTIRLILFIDPVLGLEHETLDPKYKAVLKIIYDPGEADDNTKAVIGKLVETPEELPGLNKQDVYKSALKTHLKEILGEDAQYAAGAKAVKDCLESSSGGGSSSGEVNTSGIEGDLSANVSDLDYNKPLRILLLGDSHSTPWGTYGKELNKLLVADRHIVEWVAVGSINASAYLGNQWDKFVENARKMAKKWGAPENSTYTGNWHTAITKKYDVCVISLGTNDAGGIPAPGKGQAAANNIKKLADFIKNKTGARVVFWVNGPSVNDNKLNGMDVYKTYHLSQRIADLWDAGKKIFGDNAIDSRGPTDVEAMNPILNRDGIHPQSHRWAPFVVSQIKKRL